MHEEISRETATERDLNESLRVTQIGEARFQSLPPATSLPGVFGGRVMGQALLSAAATVDDDRWPHSLHTYFVAPSRPGIPLDYQVFPIRDGGAFSLRSVEVQQGDKTVLTMTTSFSRPEDGLGHTSVAPPIGVPDQHPSIQEVISANVPYGPHPEEWGNLEMRIEPVSTEMPIRVWVRSTHELPAIASVHAAAACYASDITLLSAFGIHHGLFLNSKGLVNVSLDHSMWFHQPLDFNQWHLYQQESPVSSQGRGISRGQFFTLEGALVASTCQEALIRRRRERP